MQYLKMSDSIVPAIFGPMVSLFAECDNKAQLMKHCALQSVPARGTHTAAAELASSTACKVKCPLNELHSLFVSALRCG